MTKSNVAVLVRQFRPGDEAAFRRLNEEWIRRYFVLESKDEESFNDPQGKILDRGGQIFFAVLEEVIVGCCGLVAIGTGEFEVVKMAVAESCQGAGIGRYLLEQTVAAARESGATRLYLETNRKLGPAIRLYESVGFRELPAERVVASPYARANVYMELFL